MFAPTREESRRFLCEAWRKSRAAEPLTDLERIAALVISQHPEYHALIESPGHAVERDFAPEDGGLNPFLHLSLHLAVEEQLAIDQPPGLRARYERLRARSGAEHEAQHATARGPTRSATSTASTRACAEMQKPGARPGFHRPSGCAGNQRRVVSPCWDE
jgi:hypothetical protein